MKVLVAIHHRVDAWTIPPAHLEQLRTRFPHITFLHSTTRESDIDLAADADVVFTIALSRDAVARATQLRWLHCSGHAVGHFPLADLAARGIMVTNSRGIQAVPIAEHCFQSLDGLRSYFGADAVAGEDRDFHEWVFSNSSICGSNVSV